MSLSKILSRVGARITPTPTELVEEKKMVEHLLHRIRAEKGPHVDVQLCGSVARNTHLRGDKDLDIFVFYPPTLSREKFEKAGLALGHKIFGKEFHEEAYSEHPYVRGILSGFDVEIVPTYKVAHAHEKLAAVDRTPFHAAYMRKKLSKEQCRDVRLLKQFLKGISVYGADVKMQGVPGYLVEILILQYGSFASALESISQWREHTISDVENHYPTRNDAKTLFPHAPLIVIDPTDRSRNVAAALSLNQLARFIAATRAFLKKPSEKFFFAHENEPISLREMQSILRAEEFIGISFSYPKGLLEDMAWGQLRRLAKKIGNGLIEKDFCLRRSFEWTNGKDACVILFDVENPILQSSKLRFGPPLSDAIASARFLAAHKAPLSGPRIENGRIVIVEKRKIVKVGDTLVLETKKCAQSENGELKSPLAKAKTLSEKQLVALSKKEKDFARAFGHFLKGKEWFW